MGEWPRRTGTGDWEEAPYGLPGLRLSGELVPTERLWSESMDLCVTIIINYTCDNQHTT